MTWQNLSTAILVIIVLLPAYLLRATLFGIPTTLLEVMLLIVLALGFFEIFSNKLHTNLITQQTKQWFVLIVLLLVTATIALFIAPDHLSALGIYKAYFIEPIAFAVLLFVLLTHKHITQNQILTALGISALFVSVVGIVQWFIPSGIPIPWDFERRITSVFEYPNAVGLYLGPIVTVGWIALLNHFSSQKKLDSLHTIFWSFVSILGSIAIILAESEAAIVAVLASVFLYALIQKPTRKLVLIFSILTLAVIILSPLRTVVFEKLTLQDYSGQVRISQWHEGWNMLKDRPIFGAGLSGYSNALVPYHKETQYEIFEYPHNIFLNIWSELGLLGLITFTLIALLILQKLKPSKSKTTFSLLHFSLSLPPLLTLFIHGLVDVPYFKNDLAVLTWIFLILFIYETTRSNKQ